MLVYVKDFAKFCYAQRVYYVTQAVQAMEKVPAVVGSIVTAGALICCALFHSVCDLKATLVSVQHVLSQEFILYGFELVHHAMDTTKKICSAKSEGSVDHCTDG